MSDKASVWGRTPEARYQSDLGFRRIVDMMEAMIHQAETTPSELREASLLAAIHLEYRQLRHIHGYTMTVETARRCHSLVDEIYKAIQTDERPLMREDMR